jgi:chorismate synthase
MSIGGARGFDIGSGFHAAGMQGSEHNDNWRTDRGKVSTVTNHSGGVQGGISNGEEIRFRVAFKPLSSIQMSQKSIDTSAKEVTFRIHGRHDVTIVPRAVAVVEAMAALTVADHLLQQRCNHK